MHMEQLIWLAGLIDGEGSIGAPLCKRRNRYKPRPMFQMCMTSKETLEVAREIMIQNEVAAQNLHPSFRTGRQQSAWYLAVSQLKSLNQLALLMLPYSITKKSHWRCLLNILEVRNPQQRNAMGQVLPRFVSDEELFHVAHLAFLNHPLNYATHEDALMHFKQKVRGEEPNERPPRQQSVSD